MKTSDANHRGMSYETNTNRHTANQTKLEQTESVRMDLIQPKNTRFKSQDK
jgi:hypothetical protein